MTSNTAPSGQAISNSSNYPQYAYRAFQYPNAMLTSANGYIGSRANFVNQYCGYTFNEDKICHVCQIAYNATNGRTINHSIKICGSNDATNWTDLTDPITLTNSNKLYTINLSNNTAYRYYCLWIISGDYDDTYDNCYHINFLVE